MIGGKLLLLNLRLLELELDSGPMDVRLVPSEVHLDARGLRRVVGAGTVGGQQCGPRGLYIWWWRRDIAKGLSTHVEVPNLRAQRWLNGWR